MLLKISLMAALVAAVFTLPSVASAYDQGGYRSRDYTMRDRDRDRDDVYGSRSNRGLHYGWERGYHYGYSRAGRDRDDYRLRRGDRDRDRDDYLRRGDRY